jgi:catechol 2,3-dioxygenase-like lactoylglutathione lyase family enzyme
MSLPIVALHHISLVTRRVEESIAFYRDVLGFREIKRPPFDFRGAWLYNYGVQVHIIENAARAQDAKGPIDSRADHLAFAVADVEEVKLLLDRWKIPYREQVNAGNIRQIFFHDPDGHHIEIAVYGPPPPFVPPTR